MGQWSHNVFADSVTPVDVGGGTKSYHNGSSFVHKGSEFGLGVGVFHGLGVEGGDDRGYWSAEGIHSSGVVASISEKLDLNSRLARVGSLRPRAGLDH